jgi:hypothetical protein
VLSGGLCHVPLMLWEVCGRMTAHYTQVSAVCCVPSGGLVTMRSALIPECLLPLLTLLPYHSACILQAGESKYETKATIIFLTILF